MRYLKYLFLLLPFASFAQVSPTAGVQNPGPIIRNAPTDGFPTQYNDLGNGGFHTGTSYHGRDSLSSTTNVPNYRGLLRPGMKYRVYIKSVVDSTYTWNGTGWDYDPNGQTYTGTNGVNITGTVASGDTAYLRTVANSLSLSQLQTKFNNYVPFTGTDINIGNNNYIATDGTNTSYQQAGQFRVNTLGKAIFLGTEGFGSVNSSTGDLINVKIPNPASGNQTINFKDASGTVAFLSDITSGGTVTAVNGTTNRITSTGGATPVIDISSTFEGLLGKVANPLSQFASTTSAQLAGVISDETGTGAVVLANSPVFTTPNIGTATGNITGNSATVTTNANLTGDVTSVGNATTVAQINGITKSYYDPTSSIQTQLNSKVNVSDTSGFAYVHKALNETITGQKTFTKPIALSANASPTYAAGNLSYDTGNESLTFFNNDSNIGLQIGQEEWIRIINNTGSTIANGAAVYINGSSSGLPTIALAQANSGTTTIGAGLATESIANGATGYVTSLGIVHSLNTSSFSVGPIYISEITAGALTQTAPLAPNYRYRVGFVTSVNSSTGSIHVTPSTAALGNGSANQIFGMNSAGTAQEVKSIGRGIQTSSSTLKIDTIGNYTWGKIGGVTKFKSDSTNVNILNINNGNDKATIQRSTTINAVTLSNKTLAVAGPGDAMMQNGTNQYWTGSDTGLPISGDRTFSFTFKTTQSIHTPLIYYGTGATSFSIGVDAGSNKLAIYVGSTNIVYLTLVGATLSDGNWHNLQVAISSGGAVTAALDNNTATATLGSVTIALNGTVRNDNTGNSTFYASGTYQQLLVYNRLITRTSGAGSSDEIAAIYNGGIGTQAVPSSGKLRDYEYQEGAGATALIDAVGGNNLTLFNTPTWVGVGNGLISTGSILNIVNGVVGNNGESTSQSSFWRFGETDGGSLLQGINVGTRLSSGLFPITSNPGGNLFNVNNASLTTVPNSMNQFGAGTSLKASLTLTAGPDQTTGTIGALHFSSTRTALKFIPTGTTYKSIVYTNDAAPSNGQIPIGNGTDYTIGAITAGSGMSVTNGSGSITLSTSSSASANLTAQTTAGNITTFTVGASTATFNVSMYINITAVSVDVVQGQITYTDENNTAQTVSLSNLSAIGNSTYSPITIRAKNGTVITAKTNLTTGAGTITFDAGAYISPLN